MRKILLILIFTISFISCGGQESESSLVSPSSDGSQESNSPAPKTLLYITAYSDSINLLVGQSAKLFAIARYSDGSIQDIASTCEWENSDDTKVTVSGDTATAVADGTVTLTAKDSGKTATITLLPFSANISKIEINKESLSLPADGSSQLEAFVFYDNGSSKNITADADWTSNDTGLFTVDNTTSKGLVAAVANGTNTVSISYEGHNASANVQVSNATISSIQVTPVIGNGAVGVDQLFNATALLSDGSTQDITSTVTWSSSDNSILEVDSTGKGSLKTAGSVSITADYQTHSKTVSFTVASKTVSSIQVTLNSASLSQGILGQASCEATYSDGSKEDITSSVQWSLDNNSLAAISNLVSTKGQITTIAQGTVNITATLDSLTHSESLTISDATLSSIDVLPSETFISSGIDARFQAFGNYDDGSRVDITKDVTWSSSNASLGTISNIVSNKGYFTNLYSGSSTQSLNITATLSGVNKAASIIIAPGTVTSISVNPSSISMNTLKTQQIKAYAHFSDGASVEITNIATWSSSDEASLFVSNSITDAGKISSIAEGSFTITAAYKGLSSVVSSVNISNTDPEASNDLGTGLLATYYSGNNFNTVAGQRIDSLLNFNWATGQAPLGVGDYFSVRWQGKIKGKITGSCTIASRSDDGFRAIIGGTTQIEVWFPHAPRWDYAYNVPFEEGVKQDITVEFFENGGHAVAELYWQCDGDAGLEPIPTQYLYTN